MNINRNTANPGCAPQRAIFALVLVALAGLIGSLMYASVPGGLFAAPGDVAAETISGDAEKSDAAPGPAAAPPAPAIESGVRRWHVRGPARVALPDGYTPPRAQHKFFQTPAYQLRLYAQEFAQGRAIYAEIVPPAAQAAAPENFQAALIFNKAAVPLSRHTFGYRGFIGIAPYAATGKITFNVTAGVPPAVRTEHHVVTISATKFPVYHSAMDLGKFSDTSQPLSAETIEQIRAGQAKKNAAFHLRTENKITDRLSHPRDLHKITSPFWATRVVDRYEIKNGKRVTLKPKKSTHGGLDLRAVTGAPIYALADATVAIAEPMYYEGNLTMLDHGQGVMSIYMHQSAINVQPGQTVAAGDEIGKAGATGAVTGAHLHLAVYIRRVPVEPLSFLCLPVRN